jgi:hypothetical protein
VRIVCRLRRRLVLMVGSALLPLASGHGSTAIPDWRSLAPPHLDLLVVVMAGNYNQPDAWQLPATIITEILMPALTRR